MLGFDGLGAWRLVRREGYLRSDWNASKEAFKFELLKTNLCG